MFFKNKTKPHKYPSAHIICTISYICLWRKYVDPQLYSACCKSQEMHLTTFSCLFLFLGFSLGFFSLILTVYILWILLHSVLCRICFVRRGTESCLLNKTSYMLALFALFKRMLITYAPGKASLQNPSWNYPVCWDSEFSSKLYHLEIFILFYSELHIFLAFSILL